LKTSSYWKGVFSGTESPQAFENIHARFLFELATTNKVLNPIRGIVHGLLFIGQVNVNSIDDEIDKQLDSENSEWQKSSNMCKR